MFFPRLRRHAKWMFLFLALVFALGHRHVGRLPERGLIDPARGAAFHVLDLGKARLFANQFKAPSSRKSIHEWGGG
jgi:hypothetical protein